MAGGILVHAPYDDLWGLFPCDGNALTMYFSRRPLTPSRQLAVEETRQMITTRMVSSKICSRTKPVVLVLLRSTAEDLGPKSHHFVLHYCL